MSGVLIRRGPCEDRDQGKGPGNMEQGEDASAGYVERHGTASPSEPSGQRLPDTLILDFWPPELLDINFCCFEPPSVWDLVRAYPAS